MSWTRKETDRRRNLRHLTLLAEPSVVEPREPARSASYIRATEALVRLANLDRAMERM